MKNLPGVLTLTRIALVPIFAIFFYLPFSSAATIATVIFSIAALTDYFDGLVARKMNQMSKFGAFLDPVADKLLVAVSLVLLVGSPHLSYLAVPAAIILAREIIVSALREWMAEVGKRAKVSVTYIAKIKSTLQMIAIAVLIFCSKGEQSGILLALGYILFYIATVLTVWTLVMYLKAAWQDLRQALDSDNS